MSHFNPQSKGLHEIIEGLRDVAPRLNTSTNEAQAAVEAVERFLNDELSLGVSCGTLALVEDEGPNESGEPVEQHAYLVYRRIGQRFRVGVEEVRVESPGDAAEHFQLSLRPWSDCPRDLKLATFPHLPCLLHHALDVSQEIVQDTGKTTDTVRDVLAAIQAKA